MSDDAIFLAYALLFRFGIIGAGLCTIFLGYSLLRANRISGAISDTASSTAEASIAGAHFRLQNVTTGSIFALFGAALIVGMVVQGNPERTRETQHAGGGSDKVTMRGGGKDAVEETIQAGSAAQDRGDDQEAETRYRAALAKTAPALNALAWIYTKRGAKGAADAVPLSQSAIQLDNTNAHYWDTLAEAEWGAGDHVAALKASEKASLLDPDHFKKKLEEFQQRKGQ